MAVLTRVRAWIRDLPWALLRLGRTGGGRAGGVLRVWLWWEAVTTWWWRLEPSRPDGVSRLSWARHYGPPLVLRDGTAIRPGDPILELHLDSRAMLRHGALPQANVWRVVRLLELDLAAVARRAGGGDLRDARALHGVALLADATRRLGFEVRRLPRTRSWALVRYFMIGLLAIYHPEGWRRAEPLRAAAWPGEMWMGRATLLRKAARDRPSADHVS